MRFRYYFSNGEHVLVGDDGRDTFVQFWTAVSKTTDSW